jgi:TonB family protein
MIWLALTAASVAAGIVAPAAAQMPQMTHQEQVTFTQWSERVQSELDTNIHYPRAMAGRTPDHGIVRVKFNCSESGRPDKVTLAKSSGSPQLDRAALQAVGRISSLHPLPQDFADGQAYQAMIMFYSGSDDDYRRRLQKMSAEATKANKRFGRTQVASISIAPAGGR